MRAKTILSGLFLISLGVVAMLYLHSLPPSPDVKSAAEETLIATVPLAPGALLRAQDVAWKRRTGVPESGQIIRPSIRARETKPQLDEQVLAEVYGAALRTGVDAGDPIRRGNIVTPGDHDFLQIVLSPGARAIAIPVGTAGSSTGLLFAGDRVDVILTQTFKRDAPITHSSVSETVVENLRVLAVDVGNAGTAFAAKSGPHTVTLEVTPEQAKKLNVAAELGKLSLILRAIGDSDGVISSSAKARNGAAAIRPTWAGDVSPALGSAIPSKKVIAEMDSSVEIFHGNKHESIKTKTQLP